MSNSLLSSVFIIIGAEGEGGLFDFNATLPLMAVQIVVLSLLLNFIFYKPLTDTILERQSFIQKSLADAKEFLSKAETLFENYEEKIALGRKEAQLLVSNAEKEAQEVAFVEVSKAQQDAQHLIEETTHELEKQKVQAINMLESQVDLLTSEIKDKLIIIS
jgi:F-type H+-transporting ATPase subunit b|mmetsp:Transcript_35569/g.88732  ORF Transcript_35569/g.88732 Transcript_35569/m.88732 type:complete len:161 (+) Transcript_35569:528-1010(+)